MSGCSLLGMEKLQSRTSYTAPTIPLAHAKEGYIHLDKSKHTQCKHTKHHKGDGPSLHSSQMNDMTYTSWREKGEEKSKQQTNKQNPKHGLALKSGRETLKLCTLGKFSPRLK